MDPRPVASTDLSFSRQVGKGTFGDVYLGHFRGDPAAIKVFKEAEGSPGEKPPNLEKEAEREARISQNLQNPHIVVIYGFCPKSTKGPAIILERCECSLATYVRRLSRRDGPPAAGPSLILGLLLQAAKALEFLHEHTAKQVKCGSRRLTKHVFHSDVKAENFLVVYAIVPQSAVSAPRTDKRTRLVDVRVKLSDFGGVVAEGDEVREFDKQYAAPEVLASQSDEKSDPSSPPSRLSDSFSFSCMCLELLENKRAPASEILSLLRKSPSDSSPFPLNFPWGLSAEGAEKVLSLFERGMRESPEERPTMKEFVEVLSEFCFHRLQLDPDTLPSDASPQSPQAAEHRPSSGQGKENPMDEETGPPVKRDQGLPGKGNWDDPLSPGPLDLPSVRPAKTP
eukprot:Cvel_4222.t1-p1 / transcript=Cvel_4222.t1 / gene=Cvel_4222 / organism=Chromera_velia_CCMP2878 / gene_product=Tyrosine-protein kinase transforming protein Fps, putative / transcript_product=Tyrosine-protein kinase transforming protein Fps, putative / location=Cvel_scaffold182:89869-92212(-) / protein_length=395 / sequence_SO=supercontig / SO=protein_coding / is_pseudo=false